MRRLGLALLVAGSCLAPLGVGHAEAVDLARICNELRDPLYFSIDPATGRPSFPPELKGDNLVQFITVLTRRMRVLRELRRIETAREFEKQLNLMEAALDNPNPNASAALEQLRVGLRNDIDLARERAREDKREADEAFALLCAGVEPPATITLQPIPGLLPGIGVIGAPLPPTSTSPDEPAAATGARFVLVATAPSASWPGLTVADGRVLSDGGHFQVETTWTTPPASFGADGFSLTLACRVSPPAGGNLASGIDVRGGFTFDPNPPSFECNAQNGTELTLDRQVRVIPPPTQTSGDLFLQIGQFYSGSVTYTFRAQE